MTEGCGRGPRARLAGALPWIGVALLAYLAGAYTAWRDVFPFRDAVRNTFLGAQALLAAREERTEALAGTHIWRHPDPGEPRGVAVWERERASPGLTLLLVGQSALLIELDGTVRHAWALGYDALQGPGAVITRPVDPARLYWWRARVLPDGGLLVVVDLKGLAPEGLALARLDRDSRPLWVFHGHVHHDFDVADDGRIFALGQGVRAAGPDEFRRVRGPMLDDRVYVLSPDGRLLDDVPLLESWARSPYKAVVQRFAGTRAYVKGDYLHSNNLDIVRPADAARFPMLRAGDLLISFRELGAIATVDAPARRVTWALLGPWHQQHDPDLLESGRILLYDNQGDWDRGGHTRVIEVDPATGGIVWQYPGPGRPRLSSRIRGDQQRLPNGNTLINEQTQGHLLEVTPAGETVWEYYCPFPLPGGEESGMLCNVMATERFAPGELGFPMNEGRVAGGGGPATAPGKER